MSVYQRIPVRVRHELGHITVTFAAAFVAVAAPVLPSIVHSPDFHTAKALLVAALAAGVAAGIRAAKPLATRYLAAAFAHQAGK